MEASLRSMGLAGHVPGVREAWRRWADSLLAAAPAPADAQTTARPPAYTLRAAFPEGIDGTREGQVGHTGAAMGATSSLDRRLRAARSGDEWRIALGRPEGGGEEATLTLVAGPEGAFRRFEGVEAFHDAVVAGSSLRDRLLALVPILREARDQAIAGFVEQERVIWDEDVGRWVGLTLLPGRAYSAPRPPASTREVELVARFGARGPIVCPGEPVPGDCLVLWWSEAPDPGALEVACAGLERSTLSTVAPLQSTTTLEVVVEAATLLPRRSHAETVTRAACPGTPTLDATTSTSDRTYTWRR